MIPFLSILSSCYRRLPYCRDQFAALVHAQALPWLRRNDSADTTEPNAIGQVAIGPRAAPVGPLPPEVQARVQLGAIQAPEDIDFEVKDRHLP